MSLSIRDEQVSRLAEKLAKRLSVSKTEAVRLALENELRRLESRIQLQERLKPLQERIRRRPATGLNADKAFFDEVADEA